MYRNGGFLSLFMDFFTSNATCILDLCGDWETSLIDQVPVITLETVRNLQCLYLLITQ